MFVGEGQGAHYFWIGTDLLSPNVQLLPGRPGLVQIHFELSEPAQGFIKSVPPAARKKRSPRFPGWNSGPQTFCFSLPANWIKPGTVIEIQAEATYCSATYFAKRVKIPLLPTK